MGYYDIQQVCLNGHQTTDSYNRSPQFRKNFCTTCGEKTIHQCPGCNEPIKGDYHVQGIIAIGGTRVPTHCENCGKPFPWTERKQLIVESAASSGPENSFSLVQLICSRFHLVAKQMRSRYSDRNTLIVNDEYDTQDLLHSLLHLYFDDIRAEEWTPSYAGSCSRVDFFLKNDQMIIEVKKTRMSLKAKQLGEQLIVDTERYKAHQGCKKLICFVYDPEGWISNPRGLENDLSKESDDFLVNVIIVPKGY